MSISKAFDVCIRTYGDSILTTDLFGTEHVVISKFSATIVSVGTNLREALQQFLSHFYIKHRDGIECVNSKWTHSFINQKFVFDESDNLEFGVPVSFIIPKLDTGITIKPSMVTLVDWTEEKNFIHFPHFPTLYPVGNFVIYTGETKKPADLKIIKSVVDINGNGDIFKFESQKGDFACSDFSMTCVTDQFSLMEVFNQVKIVYGVDYSSKMRASRDEQFEELVNFQIEKLNDCNENRFVMNTRACLISLVDNVVGMDFNVEVIEVD